MIDITWKSNLVRELVTEVGKLGPNFSTQSLPGYQE